MYVLLVSAFKHAAAIAKASLAYSQIVPGRNPANEAMHAAVSLPIISYNVHRDTGNEKMTEVHSNR